MGYDFHELGAPLIDSARCEGCGQCVRICPAETLALVEGKAQVVPARFLGCFACGHCMMVCPTVAVAVSGRGLKPDDVVDLPPASAACTAEQLDTLLVRRRSVRKFKDRDVEPDLVESILRMTATAPMGIPPHTTGVVVIAGRAKVRLFVRDACASFTRLAKFLNPLMLAWVRLTKGKAEYESLRDFIRPLLKFLPQRLEQGHDAFLYDAPLTLLFHFGPYADPSDAAIVTTYAMLAAESLGLGSVMIGSATAIAFDKRLAAKYKIPPSHRTGIALAIGYPAVSFRRGIARRLESVSYAD